MSMTKAERERLERLEKLEQDVMNGRILHYDGLESVVKAYNYRPEDIGRHFLECYYFMKRSKERRT